MSNLAIMLLFTNVCLIIILIQQDYSVWQSKQANPAYRRARVFAYVATIGMLVVAIITASIDDNRVNPLVGLNTIEPAYMSTAHDIALFWWLLWGFFVLLTFGTWIFAFMQCGGRNYSYYEQEGKSDIDRG